ncbi:MAG TPA: DASS family sodium-coupled anion symporter [Ignavibacteria bacterium]|nr:DASS family sodium-coupled anion symporter [Ignavibacteria bacterium]HRB00214.1 DASS family sodium-coupled anion symporter [Ignavibacteria bacterium]
MKLLQQKPIAWISGPLAALTVYWLPLPLETAAHQVAAIMIFCLVFWITEVIPLSITALLGVTIAVMLGIADMQTAFTSLGHPIILLFFGSFLLSRAMIRHGLDKRIALIVLSFPFFQKNLFRLFLGFSLVSFLLSMWVSNSVAVAMLLPLMIGVITLVQTTDNPDKNLPVYMLLGIAYSASIGGISTIIGSPPNLIGVQYLSQFGIKVDFLKWMIMVLPVSLSMYGFLLFYIYKKLKRCSFNEESISDYLKEHAGELRPFSTGERNTVIVFFFAVFLWLLPGFLNLLGLESAYFFVIKILPDSLVALIAAILLYLLPCDKKLTGTLRAEDLRLIDWNTILLFGGGLALGTLVINTGLAAFIGSSIADSVSEGNVPFIIFFLITGILFLTEISSNTAIAITFIPIVIDILTTLQLNVLYPVIGIVIASSFAFMMPISTPPNAIVFGSGLVPVSKMLKTGLLLNITGALIIFFWVMVYIKFL